MSKITAIFWDVGGVLLSNAWDHEQRGQALAQFGIDSAEFEPRHAAVAEPFEKGELTLEDYLDYTVFFRERRFSRDRFRDSMYSLSQPRPEILDLARQLAAAGPYLMGTINNESMELNQYRIQNFGLRSLMSLFVSSCFVGIRKPDPAIYRLALELTQRSPDECCFVDDRAANLEEPARLGIHAIRMQNLEQLRTDLARAGVRLKG